MIALIIRNKRGDEERFVGEFDAIKQCQAKWIEMLRWAALHPDSAVCGQMRDRADSVTLCWTLMGDEQPLSPVAWPTKRLLRANERLAQDGTIKRGTK
jgi:hypothetical protein